MEINKVESQSSLNQIQDILDIFTESVIKKQGKFMILNKTKLIKTPDKLLQSVKSSDQLLYQSPSFKITRNMSDLSKLQSFNLPKLNKKKWGNIKAARSRDWENEGTYDDPVFTVFDDFRLVDVVIGVNMFRLEQQSIEDRLGSCEHLVNNLQSELEQLETVTKMQFKCLSNEYQ